MKVVSLRSIRTHSGGGAGFRSGTLGVRVIALSIQQHTLYLDKTDCHLDQSSSELHQNDSYLDQTGGHLHQSDRQLDQSSGNLHQSRSHLDQTRKAARQFRAAFRLHIASVLAADLVEGVGDLAEACDLDGLHEFGEDVSS